MEQGWMLCHEPWSLSAAAEAACAPNVALYGLAADASGWNSLPRIPPRSGRSCREGSAEKPRIQPRKGFVLLIFLFKRTACLAVSYSKCKANNLRTDGVGYMRCDFWWQTSRSLRLDHRLGDRAICWQRDSGSILGNSAGSDSGSA